MYAASASRVSSLILLFKSKGKGYPNLCILFFGQECMQVMAIKFHRCSSAYIDKSCTRSKFTVQFKKFCLTNNEVRFISIYIIIFFLIEGLMYLTLGPSYRWDWQLCNATLYSFVPVGRDRSPSNLPGKYSYQLSVYFLCFFLLKERAYYQALSLNRFQIILVCRFLTIRLNSHHTPSNSITWSKAFLQFLSYTLQLIHME